MDTSKIDINLSVVLYNTSDNDIKQLFDSLKYVNCRYRLIIVDNSPNDKLRVNFNKENIMYIHNPDNPGFGASHNVALKISIENNVNYHFVINPDAFFTEDVISAMTEYMSKDNSIGMMMPQILNLDGTIQNLPKLLPSPYSVLLRKIKRPSVIYKKFIDNYELRNVKNGVIYNAPILSGCFTLFNMELLKKIGLYDDRFFMYFEDWDISRRMHLQYKTLYYPKVSVYHGYEAGANKSSKLFKVFVSSAMKYFNKWGWLFDKKRRQINNQALNQFK